jgi:hypothetical protein
MSWHRQICMVLGRLRVRLYNAECVYLQKIMTMYDLDDSCRQLLQPRLTWFAVLYNQPVAMTL